MKMARYFTPVMVVNENLLQSSYVAMDLKHLPTHPHGTHPAEGQQGVLTLWPLNRLPVRSPIFENLSLRGGENWPWPTPCHPPPQFLS